MTGNKYTVPFNSAAKFAILHSSPRMQHNETTIFAKAGDITRATERPKVVMATRKIIAEDGNSVLIQKNEILMPLEVK